MTSWAMRRRAVYRRASYLRGLRNAQSGSSRYVVCLCPDACHHNPRCSGRLYARVHRQDWRIVLYPEP